MHSILPLVQLPSLLVELHSLLARSNDQDLAYEPDAPTFLGIAVIELKFQVQSASIPLSLDLLTYFQ